MTVRTVTGFHLIAAVRIIYFARSRAVTLESANLIVQVHYITCQLTIDSRFTVYPASSYDARGKFGELFYNDYSTKRVNTCNIFCRLLIRARV